MIHLRDIMTLFTLFIARKLCVEIWICGFVKYLSFNPYLLGHFDLWLYMVITDFIKDQVLGATLEIFLTLKMLKNGKSDGQILQFMQIY